MSRNPSLLVSLFGSALLLSMATASAQVSITAVNTPLSENFDTLSNSADSSVVPAGWAFLESGTNANTTYAASTGSLNGGNTYSFGGALSTDRAFGGLLSGSLTTTIGASYSNNTGTAITGLDIAYTGEMWRRGTVARADTISFEYSLDATSLSTGAWVAVTDLDFESPAGCPTPAATGAQDGNSAACQTAVAATIASLNIADGATFWIRWLDVNASGADDGLAVDNFSLTALGASPAPSLSINDAMLSEGNSGTASMTFTATLTAPAGVGGVSFVASTVDGSATVADSDYVALSAVPFTIAEGNTEQLISVTINGDTVEEPDESFTVELSAVVGADSGDLIGEGTIINDDGEISVNVLINDPTVIETDSGTSVMSFVVSLSAVSPNAISFDIATVDGSATSGTDFIARSLTAQTIPAGSLTFAFNIQIVGDIFNEPAETFTVQLANVTGQGSGTVDTSGLGSITDNDPVALTIAQLQGTGLSSPFAETTQVTLGNVVTAVGSGLFAMQMTTPDGDALTSDGVVVFTGGVAPVQVGDRVNVKGTLTEFFEFTEFTTTGGGLTVNVVGTAPLPAPIVLDNIIPSPSPGALACQGGSSTIPPTAGVDDRNFECFEGMRVSTTTGVVNSAAQSFGSDPIAEHWFATGNARVRRESGIAPEAANEAGLPAGLAQWDGNPEIFELDIDRLGLPSTALVPGTRVTATGVIGFDFGNYEFWPTTLTVNGVAPTLPSPAPVAPDYRLSIGSFNVENLFDTVDDPLTDDTVLTQAQLDLKVSKLSAYIRNVLGSPTVLGLIEVENQTALDALSARITADDPSIVYVGTIIEGNDPRGIDNAFLTRNVTVDSATALRAGQMTNECSGTAPCLLNDRPSLLLRATQATADGNQSFAVVVNHFRSLSGIDNQTALSNANRVRRKRLEQAVGVAEEVQALRTSEPTLPLIVTGDYNGFEFTDGYSDVSGIIRGDANVAGDATPRDTQYEIQDIYPAISGNIVNPPLNDMIRMLPQDERYTFMFGCSSFSAGCFAQALDQMMVNDAAMARVVGFGIGRGNADARLSDESVAGSPLGSSDHDGLVLILQFADSVFSNGFE